MKRRFQAKVAPLTPGHSALRAARKEAASLRRSVTTGSGPQLRNQAERDQVIATFYSWNNAHRSVIVAATGETSTAVVDGVWAELMKAAGRASLRSRYKKLLKSLAAELARLESSQVVRLVSNAKESAASELGPAFGAIAQDPNMAALLSRRWAECEGCVRHELPLAASIMIGAFLESLLLARINQHPDKAAINTSRAAPRSKSGQTLPFRDWKLQDMLAVAHELRWISSVGKDFGALLRGYRNFVHPEKELRQAVVIESRDSVLLWEVAKGIIAELLQP